MTRCLLPLLLFVAVPLTAQQREVRGLRAAPDVAIRLWVPAGLVEVEGWDHDSVEVRATPAEGTRFGGGGTATAMKFALENLRTNDTLLPSAQMRVFVPREAKLWIKSTVASVHVRGMVGQLDVLQVGGSTQVSDAQGVITVESIDGRVELRRLAGVVRLRGGSGEAVLDAIAGSLDASLVSGSVMAGGSGTNTMLNGRIETVSGRIYFVGGIGARGRLELTTHEGQIVLMLRGEVAPRVEVRSSGEDVVVDPALKGGSPSAGTYILRTFKGPINAGFTGGI